MFPFRAGKMKNRSFLCGKNIISYCAVVAKDEKFGKEHDKMRQHHINTENRYLFQR